MTKFASHLNTPNEQSTTFGAEILDGADSAVARYIRSLF
jgi:hypothetical protein